MEIGDRVKQDGNLYEVMASRVAGFACLSCALVRPTCMEACEYQKDTCVDYGNYLREVHPDRLRFEWIVGGGDADGIVERLDLAMDVVYEDMQSLPDAIDLQIKIGH